MPDRGTWDLPPSNAGSTIACAGGNSDSVSPKMAFKLSLTRRDTFYWLLRIPQKW